MSFLVSSSCLLRSNSHSSLSPSPNIVPTPSFVHSYITCTHAPGSWLPPSTTMMNHGEVRCLPDPVSGHRMQLHDPQNPNIFPLHGEAKAAAPCVVSTRWNPTPAQLEALEGIYRRGTRTPTADQIQQITARLKRLGNIERKNVFYWFQNRKAREKKKNRRLFELFPDEKWILPSRKKQPGSVDIAEDGRDKLSRLTGSSSIYSSSSTPTEGRAVKGEGDHEAEACQESGNPFAWRRIVAPPHEFIEFLPTKK